MGKVTFDPETTVGGDTEEPKIVPPPNAKGRRGWEQFDTLINVKVGPEEREHTFQVHRSVLCGASPSIEKALAGGMDRFKQGDDYVIELRQESASAFNHFHHWLYTDCIMESCEATDASWTALIRMWIFGGDYDVPDFQDAAMNAMIDKKNDIDFPTGKLKYIYDNTSEDSLLRQYFRDAFALSLDLDDQTWFGADRDQYPPEFLIDVIQRLHDQRLRGDLAIYNSHDLAMSRHLYLVNSEYNATKLSSSRQRATHDSLWFREVFNL